jgi:hypothetical protein
VLVESLRYCEAKAEVEKDYYRKKHAEKDEIDARDEATAGLMDSIHSQFGSKDDGKGGGTSTSALLAASAQETDDTDADGPPSSTKFKRTPESGGHNRKSKKRTLDPGTYGPFTPPPNGAGNAGRASKILPGSAGGAGNVIGGDDDSLIALCAELRKTDAAEATKRYQEEQKFRETQMEWMRQMMLANGGSGGGGGGGGGGSGGGGLQWFCGKTVVEVATWVALNASTCERVVEWVLNVKPDGSDMADLEVIDLTSSGISNFEAKRFMRVASKP